MNDQPKTDTQETDPQAALIQIREKINDLTKEYSAGALNAVQFNAIYKHYLEKRTIIEKLLERNPDTDAWRAAAAPGATMSLRNRFVARPLHYLVFRQKDTKPLMTEGKLPEKAAQQVHKLLQVIWKMESWKPGLARKSVGDGMWIVLIMGENALTLVTYFFQPSTLQINQMRDLHTDFEQANRSLLERRLPADRMVFPQRELLRTN